MIRRKAPDGLGLAGGKLWRATLREYELAPHELALLAQACRVVDRLEAISAELAASGVVTEGSMGQVRAHPLLSAQADLSRTLTVLLQHVALPLPGEDLGQVRSPQQQRAAQARWVAQRGQA